MPLDNLFRKIEALSEFDIKKETISIINQYGWYISALIRLQLQEGVDGDGNPNTAKYGAFYSDSTVFRKQFKQGTGLSKQTEFVTNYDTGAFYMSLMTIVEGTVFKQESNVSYFNEILARSSNSLLNLNKKHLLQFSEEILIPQLRLRFKQLSG